MKKQLHPGARWLFRLKGYSGSILFAFIIGWFLSFIIGAFLAKKNVDSVNPFTISSEIVLIIFGAVVLIIVLAEIYARMSYNRWFYDFTDNQLRSERGIIWKKYSNIPYERVQNVDITRGIFARMLGFSTVNIQTAGFSYTPNKAHQSEGYIPAVPMDEAEKIREFLMKKISKNSKQGL